MATRRFGFSVERAIFLTVLHRLFAPGSDRAADKWQEDYPIAGAEASTPPPLPGHGLAGSELPKAQQAGATPFAPRCVKDRIEEELFARRRDLFTTLQLVFFDTTSIYFEGAGGETIGQHGHSARTIGPTSTRWSWAWCSTARGGRSAARLWPGNTTDVTTLDPGRRSPAQPVRRRQVCIVADRGMISEETIAARSEDARLAVHPGRPDAAAERGARAMVGCARAGRYGSSHAPRASSDDPSPLKVKEVSVDDRRYVVCLNEDEARKDAADREAIVAALREQLRRGQVAGRQQGLPPLPDGAG